MTDENTEPALPKTEKLRDRIAEVLYQHILFRALEQCECGEAFDGFCGRSLDAYAAHVADAVIAELGLLREWGLLDHTDSGLICDSLKEAETRKPLKGERLRTRLVTDWVDVETG